MRPPGKRQVRVAPGDAVLAVLIAVGFGLRVVLANTRRYQVDEVEHLHAAYLWSEGFLPYRDFHEVHGPALHFLLRPFVVADDPGLTFGLGRSMMVVPGLLTLALVYYVGRQTWSHRAGMWAAALLAWHTTFAERGMEVRPDAWLAVAGMAAFAVELSPMASPRRRAALAGLCVGVGLAFSQKAVFMLGGLGLLWLVRAVRERDGWPVVVGSVTSMVPLVCFGLLFALQGAGEEFWRFVVVRPAEAFFGQGDHLRTRAFAPWPALATESARNLVFVVSAAVGAAAVGLAMKDPDKRRALTALGLLQFCLVLYLLANPYPYPYLHVAVIPAWAVLAGVGVSLGAQRMPSSAARAAAAVAVWLVVAVSFVPRLLEKIGDSHDLQITTMEELARITEPDDAVFDAVGLYLRPSAAYAFFMPEAIAAEYHAGDHPPLAQELRDKQAVAVLSNYRVLYYLPPGDLQFLEEHFVHYAGNIFVLGVQLATAAPGDVVTFEVLKTKSFRFTGRAGALKVDGQVFAGGVLRRGIHELEVVAHTGGGVLIMDPPGEVVPKLPPQLLYVNFD